MLVWQSRQLHCNLCCSVTAVPSAVTVTASIIISCAACFCPAARQEVLQLLGKFPGVCQVDPIVAVAIRHQSIVALQHASVSLASLS